MRTLADCRLALCQERSKWSTLKYGVYAYKASYHKLLRVFIALATGLPAEQEAVAKAYMKIARYSDSPVFEQREWQHMALSVEALLTPEHLGQQQDPAKAVALACKLWNVVEPFAKAAKLEGETALAVGKLYSLVQAAYQEHAYMLSVGAPDLDAPRPYYAPREACIGQESDGAVTNAVATVLPDTCLHFDALDAPAEVRSFWQLLDNSRRNFSTDDGASPAGRTLLIEKPAVSAGDALALARALGKKAQDAGLLYFELALASISGKYFGESAVNAKNIMLDMQAQAAERKQPAVLVLKDVDQFLAARSAEHAGHNQVTNALLQFINTDAAGPCRNLFIVGTTSEAQLLDGAARSRFARQVECDELRADTRAAFIQEHCDGLLGPACALELAHYASGVSMSNLAMACRDAIRSAPPAAGKRQPTIWGADEMAHIDTAFYENLWHQITLRKSIQTVPTETREGRDTACFDIDLSDAMRVIWHDDPYRYCFRTGERVWMLEFSNFAHKKRQVRLQLCDGPYLTKDQRLFLYVTKTIVKGQGSSEPLSVFEKENVLSHPMSAQKPGSKTRLWNAPHLSTSLSDWQSPARPTLQVTFALTQSAAANPMPSDITGTPRTDWTVLERDIEALLGGPL